MHENANHPTQVLEIQPDAEIEATTTNLRAFRTANLKVVALLIEGCEPNSIQLEEANRHADEAFAGRAINY